MNLPAPWLLLLLSAAALRAQVLPLPARPADAPTGSELAQRLAPLDLPHREREIFAQVISGNVPQFLRRLCTVRVTNSIAGQSHTAIFSVTPDYLAVGSDADYLLIPVSPNTAQRIADTLECSLPTRKMVNDIYAAAAVKLAPSPIPPSAAMVTVPVFREHNATVGAQRAELLGPHPLGALVAGHKKDVVLSARLAGAPGKVAIYGWHRPDGTPIQPLYLGHTAAWVDYSQCVRLVARDMLVDGQPTTVGALLADPALAGLLSDEGVIADPRYPTNEVTAPLTPPPGATNPLPRTPLPPPKWTVEAGEQTATLTLEPGVRIRLNAPSPESLAAAGKVTLVFYGLPNGNTTDQTIGKAMQPGDDWHFDIQHIGAQTRFLRQHLPDRALVVAYLENDLKSWPAWRKKNGDALLPGMVAAVRGLFPQRDLEIVLAGHSGGGSFIFGYLNALQELPADVVRIVFLDSNYAYDRALGHNDKLTRWLKASDRHFLCVLAYNDAVALLDGKSFVSAAGGTWGKSHEMQRDLAVNFQFTSRTNGGFEEYSALDGRVQFILKENPERKIFHTVQVERNGFIHAMLTGTPLAGKGYEYFGARAYSTFIR